MYEIRKGDELLALTEQPNYIRKHPEGFYLLCSEGQAQGVAVLGTPYHLSGRTEMEGCETVVLAQADAGTILAHAMQDSAMSAAAIEEALCDVDEANEMAHAEYETALCDIDEAMNGGETA